MQRTVYQIWRYNPLKEQWFHYGHIPDCNSATVCLDLLEQHKTGQYKPSQFKPWMQGSRFKLVKVLQQFADIQEIV
jgi:hypothetical protein